MAGHRFREVRRKISVTESEGGRSNHGEAILSYRDDDPYSVTVSFLPGNDDGEVVSWTFGRELLRDGLDMEPGLRSGLGDVQIGRREEDHDITELRLSSPDGNALFEIKTYDLVNFLKGTEGIVRFGEEGKYMDTEIPDSFRPPDLRG